MGKELKPKRNAEIVAMRKNGATYEKIADKYGISITRVQQICDKEIRKDTAFKMYGDMSALTTRTRHILYRSNIKSKEQLIKELSQNLGVIIRGIGEGGINELEMFVGFGISDERRIVCGRKVHRLKRASNACNSYQMLNNVP